MLGFTQRPLSTNCSFPSALICASATFSGPSDKLPNRFNIVASSSNVPAPQRRTPSRFSRDWDSTTMAVTAQRWRRSFALFQFLAPFLAASIRQGWHMLCYASQRPPQLCFGSAGARRRSWLGCPARGAQQPGCDTGALYASGTRRRGGGGDVG